MKNHLAAMIAFLILPACAGHRVGDADPFGPAAQKQFGRAVAQNIAAQTISPEGAGGEVAASAARVGKALERYRADEVEKPRRIGTRQSSGSGGDEGGGK